MPEKLNLLIPLDFLPESEAALEYAVEVGKNLYATIHMLHILEEESPLYRFVINDNQRDMIRRGASDKLDELADKIINPKDLPYYYGKDRFFRHEEKYYRHQYYAYH